MRIFPTKADSRDCGSLGLCTFAKVNVIDDYEGGSALYKRVWAFPWDWALGSESVRLERYWDQRNQHAWGNSNLQFIKHYLNLLLSFDSFFKDPWRDHWWNPIPVDDIGTIFIFARTFRDPHRRRILCHLHEQKQSWQLAFSAPAFPL